MQSALHKTGAGQQLNRRHFVNPCRNLDLRTKTHASSGVSMLQASRPVDRLRYQAKLVFDHLDTDHDGRLATEQLAQYVNYSDDRLGKGKTELDTLYTPLLQNTNGVSFEEFVDLFRAQVKALSTTRFLEAQLKGNEVGRLMFKTAVPGQGLAAALVVFKLLDFNNDGFLGVDELRKSQGIEKTIFENILEDADENEDGFLSFEDFLSSYSKERPVFMSMAVMLAHSAVFFVLLNSPLDIVFKAVIAALLLLKPAIITNPVVKSWHIIMAIVNRFRAENVLIAAGKPTPA